MGDFSGILEEYYQKIESEVKSGELALQEDLFSEIASADFLEFSFGGRSYADQLKDAVQKTGRLSAVTVSVRMVGENKVVWMSHDFGFLGGSLGCAEGEKLTRGFELAREHALPVVLECRSGGARMQEGTLSLMQMAKVSVAVNALKSSKIPFISVCLDPTYGGVSASYAMQGDVRIGVTGARVGFAGPQVILNTMFEMNEAAYDAACPPGFQTSEYVQQHGQLDLVCEAAQLNEAIARVLDLLLKKNAQAATPPAAPAPAPAQAEIANDYLNSRKLTRPQSLDIVHQLFQGFVDLRGDGSVGSDPCLRGGLARFDGRTVVVIATSKGHDPKSMKDSNFGMPSPAGYRTALRLMKMAEHFGLPVFTFIDTVGAYPSFDSEEKGQSEAIATNLLAMASLTVPIISLVVGEGGSGGALAVGMGSCIGMLSHAYYAVISPEGAASILGRYQDDKHKAEQFPRDCAALAKLQAVYAQNLVELGVIDEIIDESEGETWNNCPELLLRLRSFYSRSLSKVSALGPQVVRMERYEKFRKMGKFQVLSADDVKRVLQQSSSASASASAGRARAAAASARESSKPSRTLRFLAERTLNAAESAFRNKEPQGMVDPRKLPAHGPIPDHITAKRILDQHGPDAVTAWLKEQKQVLITDTTMRDAHQSLLATRVRTKDLLDCADETARVLSKAFSLEMWGGATFDVCYRFLNESPWDRLRALRERIPNVLFQMLLRGANAVGYKSYPDNVVVDFIKLAAKNGIDVFRIFDCFNVLEQMQLSIDTVRECGKIAEVAICFTSDFLSPKEKVYTLEYYKGLARSYTKAGAHIIGVKDMAGLLKPQHAKPFMEAIRSVTDLPVHFHCHNTSSASLTAAINMANNGCHVVDFCVASMADTTSQPSLNAFLAAMEGTERDPGIPYLSLNNLDTYWDQVRTLYAPFESGMKSGTARVYEHQIPGGQYSNLIAQSKSMGTFAQWDRILDMYRDVNALFGDIIKVTPSSKCVGDMALYLISKNVSCEEVMQRDDIEFPASVVELMRGELGFPHHGFPKAVQEKILRGKTPLECRPGAVLAPVDFAAERARLEQRYGHSISDEDLNSAVLYPDVLDKYFAAMKNYGEKVTFLPTRAFFYGLKIGESITVAIPSDAERENGSVGNSMRYNITLKRVGPLQQGGMRTIVFDVNGEKREVLVKDTTVNTSSVDLPNADASNPTHIPSPLPGSVEKLQVKAGDRVVKGQLLMIVSAMKMEVQVKAHVDGVIDSLLVSNGTKVDTSSLLGTLVQK